MRRDMAKVLVERPRGGSRLPSRKKGYRKYVQSRGVEDLPRREPLLGAWRGMQRHFNEHLGPMRRFLRGNVGRPWNKIHQELCEHVSFDSPVQKHVLTHVFDYVVLKAEVRGEVVYERSWRGPRRLTPGQMYVCPQTGLLKVVRRSRSRRPLRQVQLDAGRMCLLREGSWWEVIVRQLPDDPGELWDVWLGRAVSSLSLAKMNATYGGRVFATACRALSPNQVRALHKRVRERRRSASRRKRGRPARTPCDE